MNNTQTTLKEEKGVWITRTDTGCGFRLVMLWISEESRWTLWKWRTEPLPVIRY